MNRSTRVVAVLAGTVVLLESALAPAATPPAIARLQYSADIGANLIDANTYVARRDFVDDDLAGTRARKIIAGLPANAVLHDFHVEANGNVLFALDIGAALQGVYYRPADVIRFSGNSFSLEFDSIAAGVPDGVRCDGVARFGPDGPLLLSFDRTFAVGATTILPADVIAFAGGVFGAKVLDAKAAGIPANLDVDAIDMFGTHHWLLVSFSAGGTIGGVTFGAEDVLQFDLDAGTWSRRFDLSTFSDRWATANLDGLAATNTDSIFDDDFQKEP